MSMDDAENMEAMEVLVLGLCRTGTTSMKLALEELGYRKVYHFFEIVENPSHAKQWIELLQRKRSSGKQDITAELRRLLDSYNAVTDIPTLCFTPELLTIYPNAKIILTTRSSASWLASMLSTLYKLKTSPYIRCRNYFADAQAKTHLGLLDLIVKAYFHGNIAEFGEKGFEEHNEMVRRFARDTKRDFLEFRLGDGWVELCDFLGKSVPDGQFPHVNDREEFRKMFGLGWESVMREPGWLFGVLTVILGVVCGVVWRRS